MSGARPLQSWVADGVEAFISAPAAPSPRYNRTRPEPPCRAGLLNWESATPICRSTHSAASTLPVEIAMRGILSAASNSACDEGRRVCAAASAVFVQEPTVDMVIFLRHLPAWMTSGMFVPTGMLFSVKVPLTLDVVLTNGEPERGSPDG